MLSIEHIKSSDPAACTFLVGAGLPASVPEHREPVSVAAEDADEAADLLDDFLIALLDQLGPGWPDLVAALPDEVYARLDRWLEVRFL